MMIDGVEHVEVDVSRSAMAHKCSAHGVHCGFRRHPDTLCKRPEGTDILEFCSSPNRIFVLPEQVPIFIAARLKT